MSERESKPIRDEQTLAKVLEAAYVMQEHNRELQKAGRSPNLAKNLLGAERWPGTSAGQPKSQPQAGGTTPAAESGFSLAQIVEIQHEVQVRHLGLQNVMALVVERLSQIARVGGAAVGILEDKKVHYRAVAGVLALPLGTGIPLEKSLSVECLRAGSVFRCPDVKTESVLDQAECRRRGIQSMIAVPIFHHGAVAGSLELYFPGAQAFTVEDIHTCQLMAGLVTEALARDEEVTWKKSLAEDRAVMLQALEKLKPDLAALADAHAAKSLAARAGAESMTGSASTFVCPKCRHELVGQEQFCGNCGSPRSSDYEAPNLQNKVAALWQMQQAMKETSHAAPANGFEIQEVLPAKVHEESPGKLDPINVEELDTDFIEERLPEPFAAPENRSNERTESTDLVAAGSADFEDAAHSDLEIPPHTVVEEADIVAPEPTALVKTEHGAAWSSAANTLAFFQRLAVAKDRGVWAQFWNTRRGDIYLAIAVVLMLGVMRWAIWSSHSVSAVGNPVVSAAHRRAAPDADLSLFDQILVKLGVAEAPDPPQYKGNPRTQVWVDLQTALYYCPGADLYGKTPKGRFRAQRDAQLDQFEPAYRKACD